MITFKIDLNFDKESFFTKNSLLPEQFLSVLSSLEDSESYEALCTYDEYTSNINLISIDGKLLVSNENISLYNSKVSDESKF